MNKNNLPLQLTKLDGGKEEIIERPFEKEFQESLKIWAKNFIEHNKELDALIRCTLGMEGKYDK